MKRPFPRGSSINIKRLTRWKDHFSGFRHPPSIPEIEAYLKQFGDGAQDLAARFLDCVEVVSRAELELAYRSILNGLPGWHRDKNQREGKWRFVPFSMGSAESGDEMHRILRQALGMRARYYNELFIYPRDLVAQELAGADTVVLIDDFTGTGKQVRDSWNKLFRELVGGAGTVYLMVFAATDKAEKMICDKTDLQLVFHRALSEADNLFSDECAQFDTADKTELLRLSTSLFRDKPRGYGQCGLLYVFHHDCPNNSVPLLHRHKRNKWTPLFPSSGTRSFK